MKWGQTLSMHFIFGAMQVIFGAMQVIFGAMLVIFGAMQVIFGAYLSAPPRLSETFYGTGESWLFSFRKLLLYGPMGR